MKVEDKKAKITLEQYRRFERLKVIENKIKFEKFFESLQEFFFGLVVMASLVVGAVYSFVQVGYRWEGETPTDVFMLFGMMFFLSVIILVNKKFFEVKEE